MESIIGNHSTNDSYIFLIDYITMLIQHFKKKKKIGNKEKPYNHLALDT